MNFKNIFNSVLLFIIISTSSSCIYIKDQFKFKGEFIDTNGLEHCTIDSKNLYSLRIKDSKSNKIIDTSGNIKYSDINFHTFEQVTKDDDNNFVAEENYLYLDAIDNDEIKKGKAIFFNSYHILYPKDQRLYFNNPDTIFSYAIKELKIGSWIKKGNEISIYFEASTTKKGSKIIGHKGYLQKDSLTNNNVFILTKSSTTATAQRFKINSQAKYTTEMLDKQLLYFYVKDVFDLRKEEGLHYRQIASNRKIFHKNLPKFKIKSNSSVKKDMKYYTILDLDISLN